MCIVESDFILHVYDENGKRDFESHISIYMQLVGAAHLSVVAWIMCFFSECSFSIAHENYTSGQSVLFSYENNTSGQSVLPSYENNTSGQSVLFSYINHTYGQSVLFSYMNPSYLQSVLFSYKNHTYGKSVGISYKWQGTGCPYICNKPQLTSGQCLILNYDLQMQVNQILSV